MSLNECLNLQEPFIYKQNISCSFLLLSGGKWKKVIFYSKNLLW